MSKILDIVILIFKFIFRINKKEDEEYALVPEKEVEKLKAREKDYTEKMEFIVKKLKELEQEKKPNQEVSLKLS